MPRDVLLPLITEAPLLEVHTLMLWRCAEQLCCREARHTVKVCRHLATLNGAAAAAPRRFSVRLSTLIAGAVTRAQRPRDARRTREAFV